MWVSDWLVHWASMDSSFDGIMLDLAECSKFSIDEKRRLVSDISSKRLLNATEILQSWSRQDLLQIVCVEMGKEQKYTGWSKVKLIELLLKIVSEKKIEGDPGVLGHQPSAMAEQKASITQRKPYHPSRMPASGSNITLGYGDGDMATGIYCKNSACKASLNRTDEFCKSCSCCLCREIDDNKDPSLWLTCCSEPPFQGRACNMSCHLECFLKRGASSIAKAVQGAEFDGTFYCVSCGKVNDFLSCWRKQMMVAKETRWVDILCYRLSLCQRLLTGTILYRKVSEILGEAVKKLEADVGPLTGSSMNMGRGIVNRLSAGPEVQKLCGAAIEALESLMYHTSLCQLPDPVLQGCKLASPPNMIRFEDISATSVTVVLGPDNPTSGNRVGYTLWHRKANDEKGTEEPTCTLFPPETRFFICGLFPATEYAFKVVSFDSVKELASCEARLTTSCSRVDIVKGSLEMERSQSPVTNCSTLSNPSSVEDETCTAPPFDKKRTQNYFDYYKNAGKVVSANLSDGLANYINENPPFISDAIREVCNMGGQKVEDKHIMDGQSIVAEDTHDIGLPTTPCHIETSEGFRRRERLRSTMKDLEDRYEKDERVQRRLSSKKRNTEIRDEGFAGNDGSNEDFEKYVRAIRLLERKGHFEKSFRQKFLTWYTMRATPQEVRVVRVFVDALSDDPVTLAEQLIDTFGEVISSKGTTVVPTGFCMKVWH